MPEIGERYFSPLHYSDFRQPHGILFQIKDDKANRSGLALFVYGFVYHTRTDLWLQNYLRSQEIGILVPLIIIDLLSLTVYTLEYQNLHGLLIHMHTPVFAVSYTNDAIGSAIFSAYP